MVESSINLSSFTHQLLSLFHAIQEELRNPLNVHKYNTFCEQIKRIISNIAKAARNYLSISGPPFLQKLTRPPGLFILNCYQN